MIVADPWGGLRGHDAVDRWGVVGHHAQHREGSIESEIPLGGPRR